MIRGLTDKKNLIIDAALRLVAKKNSFDITIREIASEAQVNVAAINYYFKSKKQLFEEMEGFFMENFKDAFTPLEDTSLNCSDRLFNWLAKAIEYANHYPGILVYLKDKFKNPNHSTFDNIIRKGLLIKLADIKHLLFAVVQPKEEDKDKLLMCFSACVLFPFLVNNKELGTPENQDEHIEYIKNIINKFKER